MDRDLHSLKEDIDEACTFLSEAIEMAPLGAFA